MKKHGVVMKALVKKRPEIGKTWEKGLLLQDMPEPSIVTSDQVKIKVKYAAICGTDLGIYYSARSLFKEMMGATKDFIITGHEFCGEVTDAGESAKEFLAGMLIDRAKRNKEISDFVNDRSIENLKSDRNLIDYIRQHFYVTAEMHITCSRCHQCRTGMRHVCKNTIIKGIHDHGSFAEYLVIPVTNLVMFEKSELPPEIIAFMDAIGNAVHTVQEAIEYGNRIAILGCGIQGMLAILAATHMGASKIFVTDASSPDRLSHDELVNKRFKLAERFGATRCYDTSIEHEHKQLFQDVYAMTDETGVDSILEMSGNYRAYEDGFRILKNGGFFAALGLPSGKMELDFTENVILKGITVKGIIGRKVFSTWELMTRLLKDGMAQTLMESGFVGMKLPIEAFPEGFEAMKHGKALKVLFEI